VVWGAKVRGGAEPVRVISNSVRIKLSPAANSMLGKDPDGSKSNPVFWWIIGSVGESMKREAGILQ